MHVKNPKALTFNVAKKLCQLHKVIYLFRAQISEREFRIESLRGRYDPPIDQSLSRYQAAAEAVQREAG